MAGYSKEGDVGLYEGCVGEEVFMKRLPVFTLALGWLLMLALAGIAYGLWKERLQLNGTVYTGEVDVGFVGLEVIEDVAHDGEIAQESSDEAATCEATFYDQNPDSDGLEGLTVTVEDAYPGYRCRVIFRVQNLGTVPVAVGQPRPGVGNPAWVTVPSCYPEHQQLESGARTDPCTIQILFGNVDDAEEESTYTFSFTIEARQWNELP